MGIGFRVALVLGAACMPVGAAAAHGPPPGTGEAAVATLGEEHAAVHAAAPRRVSPRHAGGETTPRNAATGGPPGRVGRWTADHFDLPAHAIHAVLLPTGKVLFWGYPPRPHPEAARSNGGEAALWDPARGTGPASLTEVDPPLVDPDGPGPLGEIRAPLYCSGQTLLPNGAVLAAGGNLVWPEEYADDAYTNYAGARLLYTFDPWTERWIAQPSLAEARWYPSQVGLADGRTAIMGGYTDAAPGGVVSQGAEVFTPGAGPSDVGTVSGAGSGDAFLTALYPHLTTMPNGRVLLSGPWETDFGLLDFPPGGPARREPIPTAPDRVSRVGGNAVLRPGSPRGSWRVTQVGGYDPAVTTDASSSGSGRSLPWPTTLTTDGRSGLSVVSEPVPSGRSYANTLALPDGSLLQVGGGDGFTPEERNYAAVPVDKRVQILRPGADAWALGPSQREYRSYHSVAVLLPDGRVFSAGDDHHPVERVPGGPGGYRPAQVDTAEIYKPAYLFEPGPRPRIEDAPAVVGYDRRFRVRTARDDAASAVLVAPSATTHGADMGGRFVALRTRGRAEGSRPGLELLSPPRAGVAPPGYYMLFVLSGRGKPSEAEFIRLR